MFASALLLSCALLCAFLSCALLCSFPFLCSALFLFPVLLTLVKVIFIFVRYKKQSPKKTTQKTQLHQTIIHNEHHKNTKKKTLTNTRKNTNTQT